jgi:hypothetical protein
LVLVLLSRREALWWHVPGAGSDQGPSATVALPALAVKTFNISWIAAVATGPCQAQAKREHITTSEYARQALTRSLLPD